MGKCKDKKEWRDTMREDCVRDHFLDRIYGEYQTYKASVLSCPNADIFGRCYEIDVMVNFYEILAEKADRLQGHELTALLQRKNILTELYGLWLKKDDCNYREMERHVEDEIETMIREFPKEQEVDASGKQYGHNKAAQGG